MRPADLVLPQIERFPVEVGHIMMFARAIGDANPIYIDDDYARTTATGGIIAPPTFVEAGQHFDDNFPFRWRADRPWFGSGREPSSIGGGTDGDANGTDLHAETHYEYFQPVQPGMVLHATTAPGRTWVKEGRRAGQLSFRDWVTDYRTVDDVLCVRCRTVGVTTERTVSITADAREPTRPPARLAAQSSAPVSTWPVTPPRADGLSVGDVHRAVVVSDLKRAQILQYAGASGDFSPQHTDEVYNTVVAGYPSVFAHGMLTMAMTGRMLTDWLGDNRLTHFGVRFVRQVWPGDDLVASATVRELPREGAAPVITLDLATTNQHGDVVLSGYATARLEV